MTSPEDLPTSNELEALNARAIFELMQRGVEGSRQVREKVHGALQIVLDRDRIQRESLESEQPEPGTAFDYYANEELLAATMNIEDPLRCFSLKFKNRVGRGSIRRGDDELRVYVPAPEEITLREGEVPFPDRIFIEHMNVNGDKTRYELTEAGMSAYIAVVDGEQTSEADVQLDIESSGQAYEGFRSGAPTIDALYENLVNMQVVPQRRIIVGQSKPIDL